MTVVRQDLGINFPGVGESPLRSGKSPAQLYLAPALLIAAMLVGILLSFQSHDLSYRLQIVGLSLALGCLGAALLAWELSVSVGVVRLMKQSQSLRFSYGPSLDLLYPLAAGIMVLPAILALIARLRGEAVADIGFGRRTVEVLGILLAQQLWALRVPRGLELTSEGVRGVRGAGRIVLSWDDLGAASAMSTRTGAKLGLRVTSGETYILPRRLIGSDPDAVAAIINYYLRHPADRHHLAQPEFAIRLVAQGS